MLKLNNYHGLPFKDLIQQYNNGGSAFNLVKKDHTNQQLHNSMMSDETFAEDLSYHSPCPEDESMSDEQISEDEQPLDFSIKSKKDDTEKASSTKVESSVFASRSSFDQVDGDWARLNNSSKYSHSTMFNSLNADDALSLHRMYTHQLAPKLNSLNHVQTSNLINHNRYPFLNPLLLGESQSNLIHSEPSSPEGLSSASSTSSRSSSQGYYSGSSLSGANTTASFNLPSALNQSLTSSIYSNAFNQSLSNAGKASSLQAPPSYASLNFNHNHSSKQSSSTRNSNNKQQVRPSVIVSTNQNSSKTTNHRQLAAAASRHDQLDNSTTAKPYTTDSNKIVDSIDEHFRLSLGDSYKMLNSQSTPTKDVLKSNFSNSPSSKLSCCAVLLVI